MTKRNFWLAAALMFVVLWVHSRVYVMPDAFSTAIGATLGVYLAGWLVWLVAKRLRRQLALKEPLFFISVSSYIAATLALWPLIVRLSHKG